MCDDARSSAAEGTWERQGLEGRCWEDSALGESRRVDGDQLVTFGVKYLEIVWAVLWQHQGQQARSQVLMWEVVVFMCEKEENASQEGPPPPGAAS